MSTGGETSSTIAATRSRRGASQSRAPRIPRTTRAAARRLAQPPPESTPADDSSAEGSQTIDSMDIDQPVVVPTIIRLRFGNSNNSSDDLPKLKRKPGRPRKNVDTDSSPPKRIRLSFKGKAKKIEKSQASEGAQTPENNDSQLMEIVDESQHTRIVNESQQQQQQQMVVDYEQQQSESKMIAKEEKQDEEILDEKGEQKITKDGELLGGRKYKVPVFQLPTRGSTWYMCSMDPAKVLGFRDSYLFFTKNQSLIRITVTDEERDYLITTGILPTIFRSRPIAIVTARSIFKMFGSRIVQGGKRRRDDYFESSINFDDDSNGKDSEAESNLRVLPRRSNTSHIIINEPNSWMYQLALSSREFNNRMKMCRQESLKFYDPHTNVEQVPLNTQSTRIRVEMISPPLPLSSSARNNTSATIIEPEIKFYSLPVNPFRTLKPEVTEVLPEDIEKIVIDLNEKEEIALHEEENQYPIALMKDQIQTSYPLHSSRFQFDPSKTITSTASNNPPLRATAPNDDQPYNSYNKSLILPQSSINQNLNHIGKIVPQYSSSKANPQFICGVITATTGQPCRRAVTADGERCMYHKDSSNASGKSSIKPKSEVSFIESIPPNIVPESSRVVPTFTSNTQSFVTLPENVCAICFSTTLPSTIVPPANGAPCSDDHTIKCSQCIRKYHPLCLSLTTPRLMVAMESYKWLCNDCKTCVVCRTSGDEATLLICDDCDRGWHLDCSSPKVTEVPQGPWLCSLCAQCDSCDEKAASLNDAASNYHHIDAKPETANYPIYLATICYKCKDNFFEDRFCPVCLKTYSEDEQEDDDDKDMICCDQCDRWIHPRCDSALTPELYQELVEVPDTKYKCPLCMGRFQPLIEGSEEHYKALSGFPVAKPVALISGQSIRGIVNYKGKNVAVPEIRGWGKD
ncbi:chromatin structure-remodeling complex protein rsc7 [Gigaspora margarita]|uniref:Chromatin structure-remodeling complex protein rsc7 n=1 Tax=Gigaspora margarita TaxID=4874 RepID=A0A8H3X9W0_GIGMA|nr:chromatin structure-remodeling complex protein rsc7 [Gigaspora margarita]